MPIKVLSNNLPQIATALRQQLADATLKTALFIERDVKTQMRGPKHGRIYRRGAVQKKLKASGNSWKKYQGMRATMKGGSVFVNVGYKFHRASAPGEAPARDTGNLAGSVTSEQVNEVNAAAYSTSIYAARMELGGADSRGIYIAARPAFTPAAFRAVKVLWQLVSRVLKQ